VLRLLRKEQSRGDASFSVSSSLDSKKVLPIRSHWLAYTDLPPGQVDHVDFLIDGTLRWSEHHPPYNYASDDNGKNMGYLITTWIKPGMHHLAVRVTSKDGQSKAEGFNARVVAAPTPPPELAGKTWRRVVPKDFPDPFHGKPWILFFDRVGEWHLDWMGGGILDQYEIRGHVLYEYAPIVTGLLPIDTHKKCDHIGCIAVRKNGRTYEVWGNDCNFSGPFGTYRWSVSGDTLTLKPIHEGCKGRQNHIAGTWTRIA
jgi:hypothetical protein